MKLKELITKSSLALVVVAGLLPSSIEAAPCAINMTANQQTIDGYGFSSAWCGQLSAAKNNALYNTLGFSLLRIRIDPNQYWTDERINAQNAHAAGVKVLGTPWSPPAYMKDNTNVVHGSLLPSQYAAYAAYLNRAATNIGLDYVSIQNEPDWNPDYEGCVWNGSQFQTFCANNAQVISKPVVMPEALGFNDALSDPTLNDPTAASRVTIVAGHFYGNGNYVHQNALNKGKRVWETENYETGGQSDFTVCMKIAKTVSDAMNNQFSAYFWWWVNDSQTDETCLVNSSGTIIKPGYILGQFAKWIRPGATRVTATYNPQSNVYATAYKVAGGTNLVIVALNMGSAGVTQQFSISNGSVVMLEGYRTSSGESMADVGGYAVVGGSFTAALPARSVMTFVQTGGPGTPTAPSALSVTNVTGGQIGLRWINNATNATAILVERSSDNVTFTQIASLGASATTYPDTGLPGSTPYFYRVRASNNGIFSMYSNTTNATTLPGAPAAPDGLAAIPRNGSATLNWNASGGTPATGYIIKRATASAGPFTVIGTSQSTTFTDRPLNNWTAYYYMVSATNSYAGSQDSVRVSVTPLPTELPVPWADQDVGGASPAGDASYSNTLFTISGSGADIWGTADAFHYAYLPVTNDCTIIARVNSMTNTDPWAKAGVMIRQTLTAGSAHAMVVVTPGSGASFQWRATTGGSMSQSTTAGLSAPYWVKLVRSGNSFRGYVSPDGGAWNQLGAAQTITMGGAVFVGLPVTSHNNTNLCVAAFDNVWSTAPSGSWQHQDIGSVGVAGSASFGTSQFTLIGAGADVWGTADAFNFAWLRATNNCTLIARVASLENINVWSKAGVMIRETLNANSANAFIAVTPGSGVSFQYRSTTGGTSANNNTTGLTAPYWIKLVRSGNVFTGFRSPDGTNWTQQGNATTINMASTVYVGLAVTSHDGSRDCTAAFDNVSVPGWSESTPPPVPTGLSGVAGNGLATLTWLASSNAVSYAVKRSTMNSGPYSVIASVNATNYTDSSLTNDIMYYYVVSASNPAGESADSSPVSVTPQDPSPKGLAAVTVSSSQINLTWNEKTNASSFNVKRSTTNGGPYAVIATGLTATNHADSGLNGGTVYYYVVSAMVSGVETTNSAQASAMTQSPVIGGLVHRYSFNETGGTIVGDSMGGPVWNGTLPNGGTLSGGRLTLSPASQQYASLPSGVMGSMSNFTIMAWVNLTTVADWSRVFDFWNNLTTHLFLTPQCGGNGTVRFEIMNGGVAQQINCEATMSTGVWHQVAVTLTGTTGVLYVDGVGVGTNASMTINPSAFGGTTNNYIGKSEYANPYLDGALEEFRIYNAGLSPEEVAAANVLGPGQLLGTNSPVMSLAATGGTNLVFAWPVDSAGYTLQYRTNLTSGGWMNVPSTSPRIVGGQWEVDVPFSGSAGPAFYRLSK